MSLPDKNECDPVLAVSTGIPKAGKPTLVKHSMYHPPDLFLLIKLNRMQCLYVHKQPCEWNFPFLPTQWED